MNTKLTLRLGTHLISQAKMEAKRSGKSVSQMVAEYFHLLAERLKGPEKDIRLTPLVSALKGSLRGSKNGLKDYYRHLEEKYL